MLASFDQRSLFSVPFRRGRSADSTTRRRSVRLILALTIASALLGGALAPSAALAARLSTSADVALMAGPGPNYGVLTTIPAGSPLSVDGDASDGFVPVTYNGVSGWAPAGVIDNGGGSGGNADNASNGNGGGGKGNNGGKSNNGGGGGGNGDTSAAAPTDGATNASSTSSGAAPSGDASGSTEPVYGAEPASYPAYDGSLAPPATNSYSQDQILGIITDAANNYGQNPDDMVRVAKCESGLNPNAVGGGYYGLYQFVPATFAGTPYGNQSIFDPAANANAAAWMWSQGRKGEWTCQ